MTGATLKGAIRELVDERARLWDFAWNHRELNDRERTVAAIKSAEGKRLMYKQPVD